MSSQKWEKAGYLQNKIIILAKNKTFNELFKRERLYVEIKIWYLNWIKNVLISSIFFNKVQ